jgi:hypothetical protein
MLIHVFDVHSDPLDLYSRDMDIKVIVKETLFGPDCKHVVYGRDKSPLNLYLLLGDVLGLVQYSLLVRVAVSHLIAKCNALSAVLWYTIPHKYVAHVKRPKRRYLLWVRYTVCTSKRARGS